MAGDLTDIPFDHFQRYATAALAISALAKPEASVLEVGANRQRLLGRFLPKARVLYSDVEPQDPADDFVLASAAALPFRDRAYDAVVSLDVLEHIPPGLRSLAVGEMARVAARIAVITCPLDTPTTRKAEQQAHDVWRRYFDTPYPWLEEHQEFGLVDPQPVEDALRAAGMAVTRVGHGDARLWTSLMAAHFAKEAVPELGPVVAAMDRVYNLAIASADRSDKGYRAIFIGVRERRDEEALARSPLLSAPPATDLAASLASLGEALQPVTERVRYAEGQWRASAVAASDAEGRLARLAEAHHLRGQELEQMARNAAEQLERADAADGRFTAIHGELDDTLAKLKAAYAELEQAQARLHMEAQAHHATGLKLQEMSHSAVEQLQRADAADQKCIAAGHQIAELEVTRAQLQERVTSFEAEVRALAFERGELLDRCEQYSAEIDRLGDQCGRYASEVERLAAQCGRYARDVDRLSGRVKTLEARQSWAARAAGAAAAAGLLAIAFGYL